jgi:hypothetical protein
MKTVIDADGGWLLGGTAWVVTDAKGMIADLPLKVGVHGVYEERIIRARSFRLGSRISEYIVCISWHTCHVLTQHVGTFC